MPGGDHGMEMMDGGTFLAHYLDHLTTASVDNHDRIALFGEEEETSAGRYVPSRVLARQVVEESFLAVAYTLAPLGEGILGDMFREVYPSMLTMAWRIAMVARIYEAGGDDALRARPDGLDVKASVSRIIQELRDETVLHLRCGDGEAHDNGYVIENPFGEETE